MSPERTFRSVISANKFSIIGKRRSLTIKIKQYNSIPNTTALSTVNNLKALIVEKLQSLGYKFIKKTSVKLKNKNTKPY
jgi:hypothetical protein